VDAETWSLKARWVLPVLTPPVENGVIEIAGDKIVGVRQGGGATVDLGDVILLPGLVNAHTHLDLTGFPRPEEPPATFADWIRLVIRHRLRESPEQRWESIRAGISQSLRHGVALLGDISSDGSSARLLAGQPIGSTVYHEVLGVNARRADQTREAALAWVQETSGLETVRGLSPHAPYSTRHDLFAWAVSRCEPIQVHLAETPEEMELMARGTGPLVEMLRELDLWPATGLPGSIGEVLDWLAAGTNARPLGLVHANCLPVSMASRLGSNVTIIHCPRTHRWFGRDPFPASQWMKAGVPLALGTDGEACNRDLDILAEAREFALRHNLISPQSILEMITLNGAAVLGWRGRAGALVAGHFADALAFPVDSASPRSCPVEQVLGGLQKPCRFLWRGRWR
jgi:cytosine/adenosine deaminase-related metal-dependent hydrolase